MKPLDGIKVLDISRVLSGPYCAAMLSDMGAEVIKIETPGRGDDSRHFLPFKNGESGYYMYLNRNKKGITLNMKDPKAIEIFKELAKDADVVVENFRPGITAKMGISYEDISKINDQIIYASISGFGQYGPYRDKAAYDITVQALSGLMSITGFPDSPPTRVGLSISDVTTGMMAAYGTVLAILARTKTGKGQVVDAAMLDTVFSLLENVCMIYTLGDQVPQRIGNRHPTGGPYDTYMAKDDYVIIGVANDSLFRKLTNAMCMPEMADDPKFNTNDQRNNNEPEMKAIIEKWLSSYTVSEAIEIMEAAAVPCAPIYSVKDVAENESIIARDMLVTVDHPTVGPVKMCGVPVKLSDTPGGIVSPPPTLGQHNEEILGRLGYSKADIAQLIADKVL